MVKIHFYKASHGSMWVVNGEAVTMVYKTLKSGHPRYLHGKLNTIPHPFRTRQSLTGSIRQDESFRCNSSLKSESMRCRGAIEYNRIPADIRNSPSLETLKKKLRQWVKINVDLV